MDIYADNILDHYRHPRLTGELKDASTTHHEANPSCGDELTIDLIIDKDIIKKIAWRGSGCAISQGATSMLAEELEGKTVKEIEEMHPKTIYDLLGVDVGPSRFKCALLSLHTLKNAIRSYKNLPRQSWVETVELED